MKYDPIRDIAYYDAGVDMIWIDTFRLKLYPRWRRQWVALWAHETIHRLCWYYCRVTTACWDDAVRKYNDARDPERLADVIQNVTLVLLGGQIS